MKPLVPIDEVTIFYDGILSEPQLNHPECVAIDQHGNIWCGGEKGEIFKIDKNGSTMEQDTTTDGFILGLTIDSRDNIYICDMKHCTVFRYNMHTKELIDFTKTKGKMKSPNFAVIDEERNCLYVSDSVEIDTPAPGIWKFDLTTGEGGVWFDHIFNFANGLELSKDGKSLFVAETFANKVSKVTIDDQGNPSTVEDVVVLDGIPDGLVIDEEDNLYICCYEPSRVYRINLHHPDTSFDLIVDDPHATTLCHPTNGAIRGSKLFLANLGRWHISAIDLSNL
ncbi:SMP-30/gluconolactonase/LRE family protein [Terrihalobacillus insolitus]|uniref:SMP-30/gluconolactonase/LRE family protein n=1 Tax=Terrihalobacillus insolitus TaxID=2950438 RepID=UPI00234060D0|nr:SMP-30/gluconolactonase/LRE family protein [Terrihalobacillus insolitus]MDC3415147.1 SMP-30/gluconolactonase/LRE family protein [Terrihalobacillus insolitus]